MGGGGSSGGGGVNTGMTGGGFQLYNALGYDPSQPQGGGFNWGGFGQAIGGGLQNFGQSMQSGGGSIPQIGDSSPFPQSQIETGAPYAQNTFIPQTNVDDLIARLLGGYGGQA
jgi:hypothetical protein